MKQHGLVALKRAQIEISFDDKKVFLTAPNPEKVVSIMDRGSP